MDSTGGGVLDLLDSMSLGTQPLDHRIGQQTGTDALTAGPLSPWAQRYGVLSDYSILKDGELQHSGYVTEQPRLDPKFYGAVIPQAELDACGRFHHPNDIARYFWIEHMHLFYFRGIRPWQYAPLNQYVVFSHEGLLPGGHWQPESRPYTEASPKKLATLVNNVPVVDADRIQVDENNWLPFFHRDRWYDSVGSKASSGKILSIDRHELWDPLRLSIELVNKNMVGVLNTMIDDQHPALHTLLFGKLFLWKDVPLPPPCPEPFPGAKVLLSYKMYRTWCNANNQPCDLDESLTYTPDFWRQVILEALQDQTWGFSDDPMYSGLTFPQYNSVIVLGSEQLETLSRGDITLAEQCHLTYYNARTILHELMHAIMNRRVKLSFGADDPTRPWNFGPEPFLDFDPISEMGYAMEQRMFGGVIHLTNHGASTYPLGIHHRSWPHENQPNGFTGLGYKIGNHPFFHEGNDHVSVVSPLPGLYSAKMLSSHFWRDGTILQKSDNFFHRTTLLAGRTPRNPVPPFFHGEIVFDDAKLAKLSSNNKLQPGDLEMIESWRYWESLWKSTGSSWYPEAKLYWASSPWADVGKMNRVLDFGKYFSTAQEIKCANVSEELSRIVAWNTDKETYKQLLLHTTAPNGWIWHSIGLLTMAAVPIRKEAMLKPSTFNTPTLQLFPSERAPRIPPLNIVFETNTEEERCEESEFYNPVLGGQMTDFEHIHYLYQVRVVFEILGEAEAQLSKPWLFEIMRILDRLEHQRRVIKENNPNNHMNLAATDWDFKVPDYNPTEKIMWHEAKKEWETSRLQH